MIGEMLATVGEKATVEWIQQESLRRREVASEAGRWHHDVFEALLLDRAIPDPPEWLLGHQLAGEPLTQYRLDRWADGLVNFLAHYQPDVQMSEATVYNLTEGYAGTLDTVMVLPHYGLTLIDAKSGATVDRTTPVQCEAYRRAELVGLPFGEFAEMPPVQHAKVLHLRPHYQHGYKLLPMPSGPRQWGAFLDAKRQLRNLETLTPIGRRADYPPSWDDRGRLVPPPSLPMIEDVEFSGFPRSALVKSGLFEWLPDLAQFTADDLLSVPKKGRGVRGVGEKSIDAIRGALAAHGLALAGEQMGEVA